MEGLHIDLPVSFGCCKLFYRLPYFSEKAWFSIKSGHASMLGYEETAKFSNTKATAQALVSFCVPATMHSVVVCRVSPVNY